MCKNNKKIIYFTFIQCICKFERHKQSFLSENYEQTFPNKKQKQSNAYEEHKEGPTRYAKARGTSADSITPRSF